MKLASALIRVSTSQQELDSQIYDLRLEASKLGYTITDDLIFGQKITGYDGGYGRDSKTNEVYRIADRDSISELKHACEQDKEGKIKAIFIWELSRLSRKPSTLLDYIEYFNFIKKPLFFTSHNIWTIDPHTGIINDNGKVMINMLATFGEQERNKIMERYQRGKRFALTEDDRYVGGYVPYGYDIEEINGKKYYIIHEERSKIIEEIYNRYLYDGWASDKVARYLNQKEIPTYYNIHNPDKDFTTNIGRKIKRSNIRWSHTSVLQILRNPFYKGERTYMGVTTNCTPIIDVDMWQQVQELMKDNNKFGKKTRKFNYPVKELLRCGECGSKFYGIVTSSKQNYYCNRFQLEGEKCNCNKLHKYRLDGIIWSFLSLNFGIILRYFEEEQKNNSNAKIIKRYCTENQIDEDEIIKLKESKSSILRLIKTGAYTEDEANEEALNINKLINEYNESIKKRNVEISLLEKIQKKDLSPETIKKEILDTKGDITKITSIVNKLIKEIKIYNIEERQYTLIQIKIPYTKSDGIFNIIYDHSDKSNYYYYVGGNNLIPFDYSTRKFILPKSDKEYMTKLAELAIRGKSTELEYIGYSVSDMIANNYCTLTRYDFIEENPFTIANPDYVKYKKKDNARRNELKKARKKKIGKDYIKTSQEEYKYKVANLHNKRSKIRKMEISDDEKEKLLNETRIELDSIRKSYNK